MKKEQIKGSLSLFLAAIIWGAAFVAQSVGMDYVGPFTFNCVRTLIGGIVLIPCIAFLNRGKVRKKTNFTEKKRLLLGGIGLERVALLKYEIDDMRLLYENDKRFLSQF